MLANEVLQAAAADKKAENVQLAYDALEQAGRGILRASRSLATGVSKGDELHTLIIVQGYINEAAFALSVLAIDAKAPEPAGPALIV